MNSSELSSSSNGSETLECRQDTITAGGRGDSISKDPMMAKTKHTDTETNIDLIVGATKEVSKTDNEIKLLQPPDNFGVVRAGHIYRSSFVCIESIPFLVNNLNLKSVLYLKKLNIPTEVMQLYKRHNIRVIECDFERGNKGLNQLDSQVCSSALRDLCDESLHPILVHCKHGKHRTGTLIGVYRRLCDQWSISSIIAEYNLFAGPKSRIEDHWFIESFEYDHKVDNQRVKEIEIDIDIVNSRKEKEKASNDGDD